MLFEHGKRIVRGSSLPRDERVLAELRLENTIYNPLRKDDPHFSEREKEATIERVRELYGDTVAREAEKRLNDAFLGKPLISGRKADEALRSIRQFGKNTQEGLRIIARGYDPKVQLGKGAKVLTNEKISDVITETETKSGRYPAEVLKKGFRAKEAGEDSSGAARPKASERIVGLREGLLPGFGKKSGEGNKV